MTDSPTEQPSDPGRLSRERVMKAALAIVDRDGVEGLSMPTAGAGPQPRPHVAVPARCQQERPARRSGRAGPGAADGRHRGGRLGRRAPQRRSLVPPAGPGAPQRRSPAGDPPAGDAAGPTAAGDSAPAGGDPRAAHPGRLHPGRGTPRVPVPLRLPARSRARRAPGAGRRSRTSPTTSCGSGCTGYPCASSRCFAASRRSWPTTTAPSSSSAAWTSFSPGCRPSDRRARRAGPGREERRQLTRRTGSG